MQRRQALQRLLSGLSAGSLLGPATLSAQAPEAVQPGVVQTGPGGAGTIPGSLGNRPQVEFQPIAPECQHILRLWERYTQSIQSLHGTFDRYIYDSTFLVEKRATGEFWYEAPDLGRLDFTPMPDNRLPEPNQSGQRLSRRKKDGPVYTVQADQPSRWVCRGDALLSIDIEQKTYFVAEIPAHMQGKNIVKSPLPFIFGMSAAAMEERYYLTLGAMHNPRGTPPMCHVVAHPKRAEDAREWMTAEIILDPGTKFKDANGQPVFVPMRLRLVNPTGAQETVYLFNLDQTKLNERRLFSNPFKDPGLFSGYKCVGRERIAYDDEQQRAVQGPADNSQIR